MDTPLETLTHPMPLEDGLDLRLQGTTLLVGALGYSIEGTLGSLQALLQPLLLLLGQGMGTYDQLSFHPLIDLRLRPITPALSQFKFKSFPYWFCGEVLSRQVNRLDSRWWV